MRILLVGVATVALSGCSWLGLGGQHNSHHSNYNQNTGYYHAQHAAPKSSCQTNQCLSRLNLEFAGGPEWIAGGKALTGSKINDNGGIATVNDVRMRSAFDDGYRAELGGSYALNPNRKVTANAFYAEAKGQNGVELGTLNGNTVTGGFSDYESYGAEIGIRQYMQPRRGLIFNSVRPYVEGKLGAAHVDDISITNAQGGDALFADGTRLYDGGWVPTAAGMIGFETPVLPQMTLGLESGIRYTGKLDTDTSDLGVGTLAGASNNGSDRWTVPVMLRGRYRF